MQSLLEILLRQTMTTVAPILASPKEMAYPIPAFAPVTKQIFPIMDF